MTIKALPRKGQLRVVELIIAVSMTVMIMLLVAFFTRPMRSAYLREVSDLRLLAYNLLNNLAEAGVFERIIGDAISGDVSWEGRMRMLVASSLPPGIVFKMQIYYAKILDDELQLIGLDRGTITNMDSSVKLRESEAVHFTYVCTGDPDRVRGEILYIVLVIGYAG